MEGSQGRRPGAGFLYTRHGPVGYPRSRSQFRTASRSSGVPHPLGLLEDVSLAINSGEVVAVLGRLPIRVEQVEGPGGMNEATAG